MKESTSAVYIIFVSLGLIFLVAVLMILEGFEMKELTQKECLHYKPETGYFHPNQGKAL